MRVKAIMKQCVLFDRSRDDGVQILIYAADQGRCPTSLPTEKGGTVIGRLASAHKYFFSYVSCWK